MRATLAPALLALVASLAPAQSSVVIREVKTLPSWQSLKYPPLKEIPIPKPEIFTLPDGMKVYLLENHELPLISGSALVRTGNLFDPPDKHGLSEIAASVMRTGGTKAKTGDQLDVELEDIAASVESQMGESDATASFSCLRDNLDEVLGVFHDVLTGPEFRQDKIDLIKTQLRSSIARRNDDPNSIVSREFESTLYGKNTPYGWRVEYADLDRIHRDDLIAFYKRYYFPANILLAVYGDFNSAQMKAKLEKVFDGWTYRQPEVPPFPPVSAKPSPGIFLASKEDVTQTFFEVGHLGGMLKDKDFAALDVASDILGSGFTSRLVQRVRTRLGYAYSIDAAWSARYDHPGTFLIIGSTQSQHTAETLEVIREEVEKMRSAEVTDEELRTAKDRAINSFVFFFDRPSKTLNRLVLYDYYGYPKNFIFDYQKAIGAVTRADVLRVTRQYWHPEQFAYIAVGNPKEFGKPLTALNLPVKAIDLSIPEPKAEEPKADAASLAKGAALLARMKSALGGADKLAGIQDTDWTADVNLGPMKAKQRNQFLVSGAFRQEQQLPIGKFTVYSDGKTGWMFSMQGMRPLPGPVLEQVRMEMFRNLWLLALSDRDPARTIQAVSDDTLEISDRSGHSVKVELDPKSGLPVEEMYKGAGMGAPADAEEKYSDWHDVSGIQVPFKISIVQAGRPAEITVTGYKINTGLKPEDLSKKP